MLKKFNQLAEQAATNVSRRQFLGRFGRGAMVMAAVVGGLLIRPEDAHAGRRVCGLNSVDECIGQPEGSVCHVNLEEGRCKRVPGSSGCLCQKKVKDNRV
jgi:hypothetical protein